MSASESASQEPELAHDHEGIRYLSMLLALLSGALSVLAFAPFEIWPLLPLCYGIFFAGVYRCTSPRQVFLFGYLFGLGYFGAGIYWIYYSLHLFGGAIAALAVAGTFAFVAFLALFPAFFGRIALRLKTQTGTIASGINYPSAAVWFLLVAPAVWMLSEWIRSWLFTGFPWLTTGYATLHSPVAGYAPIGGVFLNTLLIAICSGAVGLFLTMFLTRRLHRGAALAAVLFVAVIFAGGTLLSKIQWTTVSGEPVSVVMVQGNIKQELKFNDSLVPDSLDIYSSLSLSRETVPDLIIWPESAIPAFFSDVQGWIDGFVEEINERGTTVISGGFLSNDDFTEYYNAIKVLGGSEEQVYTKRHLVPFGEFMPFRSLRSFLARFVAIPLSDLSPGHGPVKPMQVNGVYYGMSICYEDLFGNEMKVQLPQANVLINVSNDAWFGDSTAPHQHQEIAAMRALEFQRPMLRVTNTGISSMISRYGKIVVEGPQAEAVAIDVEVVPRTGSTPFVVVGNWLAVILALLIVVWRWCANSWFNSNAKG